MPSNGWTPQKRHEAAMKAAQTRREKYDTAGFGRGGKP
jgi:hypothetical protein